jgi:hypothetical protein
MNHRNRRKHTGTTQEPHRNHTGTTQEPNRNQTGKTQQKHRKNTGKHSKYTANTQQTAMDNLLSTEKLQLSTFTYGF